MRYRAILSRLVLPLNAVCVSFALAANAADPPVTKEPRADVSVNPAACQTLVSGKLQADGDSFSCRQQLSPVEVEQWFGNRLRIKRFNGYSNYEARDYPTSDYATGRQPDNRKFKSARNAGRRDQLLFANNERSNQARFEAWVSDTGNQNDADTFFRMPDRLADTPELDANGVRHFSNGKHFDLNKISLDQAIDAVRASDLNVAEARRRLRRAY